MRSILYTSIIALFLVMACKPQVDDTIDIGTSPTAAFDVTPTANPNKFTLTNKTVGSFLQKWDLGDGTTADSTVVLAVYPRKGTYKVTLNAFGKGGMGTITKDINVLQDDLSACTGNIKLLTNCGTKKWKLAPEASSLWVGPDANFGTTWWAIPEGDISKRPCMYNDEYSFSADGTFKYISNGDFWADEEAGTPFPAAMGLSIGCQPTSALPAAYKAWGDATARNFTISPTELKLIGTGAYLGLYKIANGALAQTPQATVTYQIKELTETRMVIYINFGVGFWRFTLVPV
ncbi:MAG: PKD domain-containing protein [Saprospiraceae bacterium]|nr:PKD domain-containing protein [Saprospiraceae bacterium]